MAIGNRLRLSNTFLMLGGLLIVMVSFLATPVSDESDKSIFFLSLTGVFWFLGGIISTIAWNRNEEWLSWLTILVLVASMISKYAFMWYGLSAYFRLQGF